MTRPVLVVRAPTPWRHVLLTALAMAAHLVLGLLVMTLRTVRVIVAVAAGIAVHAEQQLAARTGRPALSQIGIGVLASAFAHEFLNVVRQPTR